jgi:hypothetical protein
MDTIKITQTEDSLSLRSGCIASLQLEQAMVTKLVCHDVNLSGARISDANLSDLEVSDAQLGGAFIHNIGLPPKGHPFYQEGVRQRPLRFENCDLNTSTIRNCDLSGAEFTDCNFENARIDGILVTDLLKAYFAKK